MILYFYVQKWLSESYYKNRAMYDRAQVKFQGPKYIFASKEKMEFYFTVNRKKTTIYFLQTNITHL